MAKIIINTHNDALEDISSIMAYVAEKTAAGFVSGHGIDFTWHIINTDDDTNVTDKEPVAV